MGISTMGALNTIPPVMRRYEEMVRIQEKSRRHEPFEDTGTYLGAPIRSDVGFVGISFHMRPAPDFVPFWELEYIARKELKCSLSLQGFERIETKLGDVRRHGTFMNCHEIVYFPMLYGRHPFPSEIAKYLWACRSSRAIPDTVYLTQLKKCFMSAIQKFRRSHEKIVINNLMLNDSLYCLNWFNHHSKEQIIRILTNALRKQKHVNWISAENTLLPLEDGLRLLLAISITTGISLKALHLWHFFNEGVLPIKNRKEQSLEDPYISYKTDFDDNMISYMFFCFVMRGNYAIPLKMRSLILNTAFYLLESLKSLSVEYRYIAGGQGESLLYLGCIRNGTLRELNILFTHCDYLEVTKRFICDTAWTKAYKLNPFYRVNFVAPHLKTFGPVLPALVMCMPVEGFYASTALKSDNSPSMIYSIADILVSKYSKFLRKVNLYLCHTSLPVDHVIAKLLMELPFLEEFSYRGPLTNVTSLHMILNYIEKHNLRMTKFQFYLIEDPCNPEPYSKAIGEIYDQYEPIFISKGIHFILETCRC